jgi:large exoprotein involved in heme utilization and adhesion
MRGDSAEQPAGNAGNVTIEGLASPGQSVLIDGSGSGVFTNTEGIGTGGNILVNANSVTLQNGGMLSVATSGTQASATGGTITVNAGQVQLTSGALITASTTGAGAGGSIAITAGSAFASSGSTVSSSATQATGGDINISAGQLVTLDNGSVITASSNGEGNAGNIEINAGQQYTSTNSSVTTKAEKASGGNITVLATGLVHLTNSEINASVEGSTTTVGGNILVDPVYVILENSQILAQATQGQGGNINIFYTGALLADPSTVISASSQFGQSGTVTIQSPISPASGKIVPLGQKSLVATALLSQRCAAVAGGSISSFTVAGRDSVPAEPGGWLSSPLALSMSAPEDGTVREADRMLLDEAPLLSVRKIAPPGFLTQSFGLVGSADCTS